MTYTWVLSSILVSAMFSTSNCFTTADQVSSLGPSCRSHLLLGIIKLVPYASSRYSYNTFGSNISFAAYQYEKFGYYTNSMIVVNTIHALYVIDFFYNEDWYLRTIVRAVFWFYERHFQLFTLSLPL